MGLSIYLPCVPMAIFTVNIFARYLNMANKTYLLNLTTKVEEKKYYLPKHTI